jgi:hypothetical protein
MTIPSIGLKRVSATVLLTCILGIGWIVFAQDSQTTPQRTPLGPPTAMFEATDLNGNPLPVSFYLTGSGGLLQILQDSGVLWVQPGARTHLERRAA